ncbi:MAG: CPBP family intramembrane metalloprotease [Caldisericaceae bacterium]|nr:CPBP family intramembrane metalloprotease [Caldisericaceae bacterium]
MDDPKEIKHFPEPVEALIVVLASFFFLILMIIAVGAISGAQEPTEMIENSRSIYIFGGLVFLLFPLVYARLKKYELAKVFRLNPVPVPVLYLSVVYGLGLTLVGDELDRIVQLIFPAPEWLVEMLKPLQAQSALDWLQVLLGAVLIAAAAEELLFRGFLQISLEKKGDVTRAVILTSIAWTLIHQNPYWAVQIFIMGVLIGYVAWRTDSVLPSIIIHGLYNFLGVLFVNVDVVKRLPWYEWRGHVNPLLVLLGLTFLIFSIKNIDQIYRKN